MESDGMQNGTHSSITIGTLGEEIMAVLRVRVWGGGMVLSPIPIPDRKKPSGAVSISSGLGCCACY